MRKKIIIPNDINIITENLKRELVKNYTYLILGILLFHSVLYYIFNKYMIASYILSGFFLVLYTWIIIPKKSYNIKLVVLLWFIFGPLYCSIFILGLWDFSLLSFLWVLPLPLGSYIFFSFRTVIYHTIYIFLYIAIISLISYQTNFFQFIQLTKEQKNITDIFLLISFLSVVILLLYYLNKINLAKYKPGKDNQIYTIKSHSTEISEDDLTKYKYLFSKIVEYMKKEEPFKRYDFSISELSFALNSNHSYISKAIKINGYPNFNTFLNTYRVQYVKDLLQQNKHSQYTLRYIYSEAGFTHQSTFNRVFKIIEGITPTQYITSLETETEI